MNHYQKIVLSYLFIVISTILSFLIALYMYDPMQIFHKSYFRKELYLHSNMRQQAAGIINNFDFDSIIIGTSMFENTSSIEASSLLGGKFINISLSGSDFFERQIVLDYALKKKKIKNILYSLDSVYIEQKKGRKDYPLSTFRYLYDSNSFNDFQVYMNKKFLKCLLQCSDKDECIGKKNTLEYPNAWYQNKENSVRFGGLNNWFKAKNNKQIKTVFSSIVVTSEKIKNHETISMNRSNYKLQQAKKYIDETLLAMVKQYPTTNFIFVFPPYSRITYAMWAQYNKPNYYIHQKVMEYLVIESSKYKNLKIYGFEDQTFLDNLANYKDTTHYHYTINSMMLKNITENKGLLTLNNFSEYSKKSEEKALNYDLIKLGNTIDTYLKKSL